MDLHELHKNFKSFDIREEVREVIRETSEQIAELNRGQLFLGKRPDDSELDPYSNFYADFKSGLSHPIASIVDRRTLYLTGEFWRSIKVKIESEEFNLVSDDAKATQIFDREGEVLGLSNESKDEYQENYFEPNLIDRIQTKLGIK